jgi:hypothetical protein
MRGRWRISHGRIGRRRMREVSWTGHRHASVSAVNGDGAVGGVCVWGDEMSALAKFLFWVHAIPLVVLLVIWLWTLDPYHMGQLVSSVLGTVLAGLIVWGGLELRDRRRTR